jgi:hypothetical protein
LPDIGKDHTWGCHTSCGLPICQEHDKRDPPHTRAIPSLLVAVVQDWSSCQQSCIGVGPWLGRRQWDHLLCSVSQPSPLPFARTLDISPTSQAQSHLRQFLRQFLFLSFSTPHPSLPEIWQWSPHVLGFYHSLSQTVFLC